MQENLKNVKPNTNELEEVIQATPSVFFKHVKNSIGVIDRIQLNQYLATSNKLLDKALSTGQRQLARRLEFKIKAVKGELALNELGVNKYIYRDDILLYMDKVTNRSVKLSELRDYLREIPDEAVKIIKKTEGFFSDYLVLYTDYTDEQGKAVEQKKRDKDPILFGIFYDDLFNEVTERFYYLYDWEDDYCDLTLDKMIEEYKDLSDEELVHYSKVDFKAEREDLRATKDEIEING